MKKKFPRSWERRARLRSGATKGAQKRLREMRGVRCARTGAVRAAFGRTENECGRHGLEVRITALRLPSKK